MDQAQLEEMQSHASRSQELQKEVKEKKLLIEKLRHEGDVLSIYQILVGPTFNFPHFSRYHE
jgi:hypothetical protein